MKSSLILTTSVLALCLLAATDADASLARAEEAIKQRRQANIAEANRRAAEQRTMQDQLELLRQQQEQERARADAADRARELVLAQMNNRQPMVDPEAERLRNVLAQVRAREQQDEQARIEAENLRASQHQAELLKLAEQARQAEQAKADAARVARLAEDARIEKEARMAEEARLAKEARRVEKARKAEEERLAKEARKAEKARVAAEKAQLEAQARVAAEKAKQDAEAMLAEEKARMVAEKAQLEEQTRVAVERAKAEAEALAAAKQAILDEEARIVAEAERRAEAAIIAADNARLETEAREAAEKQQRDEDAKQAQENVAAVDDLLDELQAVVGGSTKTIDNIDENEALDELYELVGRKSQQTRAVISEDAEESDLEERDIASVQAAKDVVLSLLHICEAELESDVIKNHVLHTIMDSLDDLQTEGAEVELEIEGVSPEMVALYNQLLNELTLEEKHELHKNLGLNELYDAIGLEPVTELENIVLAFLVECQDSVENLAVRKVIIQTLAQNLESLAQDPDVEVGLALEDVNIDQEFLGEVNKVLQDLTPAQRIALHKSLTVEKMAEAIGVTLN